MQRVLRDPRSQDEQQVVQDLAQEGWPSGQHSRPGAAWDEQCAGSGWNAGEDFGWCQASRGAYERIQLPTVRGGSRPSRHQDSRLLRCRLRLVWRPGLRLTSWRSQGLLPLRYLCARLSLPVTIRCGVHRTRQFRWHGLLSTWHDGRQRRREGLLPCVLHSVRLFDCLRRWSRKRVLCCPSRQRRSAVQRRK